MFFSEVFALTILWEHYELFYEEICNMVQIKQASLLNMKLLYISVLQEMGNLPTTFPHIFLYIKYSSSW